MARIYFDNNATTALDPAVQEALLEVLPLYGNPSSIHWAGQQAKRYLNEAREFISSYFQRSEREVIFTSGGSESINFALKGIWAARDQNSSRKKIISSPLEHHATLRCLDDLKDLGADLQFLKVDAQGRLDLHELEKKLDDQTLLVSLMWVNNELGNIYDIEKIAQLCRSKNIPLHVDAVQGVGKLSPKTLAQVDLFSFSAHKFHAPKGIGGLCIRDGIKLHPLILGGRQERSLRAGTENLAGIWGMKMALEISDLSFLRMQESRGDPLDPSLRLDEKEEININNLRDYFESKILANISHVKVNGDLQNRLHNTSNILFEGVDGESLLLNLDMQGLAAAAGAACESGSIDPSHVLKALGFSDKDAKASLRFSFSKFNTKDEVDIAVEIIQKTVTRLRDH